MVSVRAVLLWTLLLFSLQLGATPLSLSNAYEAPIGQHFWYLQEDSGQLSADQVLDLYYGSALKRSESDVLSLGLNAQPVWMIAQIQNDTTFSALRRIQIENSWVDSFNIYMAESGHIAFHQQLGDQNKFRARPVRQRFLATDYTFPPGETLLLIRVQQAGPMVLPVYLLTLPDAEQRTLKQTFSYALLYGAFGALLLYNLILYGGLRDTRYLLYSLYVLAFLAVNISYTGYGYQLLWPDAPGWQRYSNVVLMTAYIASGLLFAIRFLNLSIHFPRFALRLKIIIAVVSALIVLLLMSQQYLLALFLLFASLSLFPYVMVAMGVACLKGDRRNATYFLLGAIFAALGTSITAAILEGILPYSTLGLRALELGMFIDATLLAAALAFRFRDIDGRRSKAERLANFDSLTGIYNRRAFYEQANPLWSNSTRNQHSVCILLLDIDHFKKINDNHGHACGDRVLAHMALAMKKELRPLDLLARWGGEEFIVLLPQTNHSEGMQVAERVRQRISELSHSWGIPEVSLSASLGVAAGCGPAMHLDELIAIADKRLYRAKEHGRNQVCGTLAIQT